MKESDNRRFAKNLGVAADVFDRPVVTLQLPAGQEERPEAVAAFMLAANLLKRLFTKVYLAAPDASLGTNPWGLARLSELPESLVGVSEGEAHWGAPSRSDIVVGVGAPPSLEGERRSFFTFNGWLAGLEQDVGNDQPGICGALFAACYGAAQCFLHAATAVGADYWPIEPFRISLLTYDFTGTNAPMPKRIDFREAHLVGVGAVGSAFVYALAHLPGCVGVLHLIDNDAVDDPNLERYILMRKRDVTRNKTDVAEDALRRGGPRGASHPVSMPAFQAEHGYNQDLLISPVDSELGRRKLAAGLPRAVLNAATGGTNATVSRHGFADGKACLYCLYLPQIDEVTTEKRLATDMQVPLEEVEALIAANEGVSEDFVRRVEKNLGFDAGKFQGWVGRHIQSFYQRAVCGEAKVNTPSGTIVSPLPFISAAAGVLLAAEFVKMHVPEIGRFALDNFFRVNTLYAPKSVFRQTKPQDPTGRCICRDRDYVDTYREKFGAPRVASG